MVGKLTDEALFQCSSASRKFLNRRRGDPADGNRRFQCSSASRKFLNFEAGTAALRGDWSGFSALQRAENFSTGEDFG